GPFSRRVLSSTAGSSARAGLRNAAVLVRLLDSLRGQRLPSVGRCATVAGRDRAAEAPPVASVGEMLRFLRPPARLTQRPLGLAVGYTEGHISRIEHDQRPADVATVAALFVPALGLDREPELAARLLELAAARGRTRAPQRPDGAAPAIPAPPPGAVVRAGVLAELRGRLAAERRGGAPPPAARRQGPPRPAPHPRAPAPHPR